MGNNNSKFFTDNSEAESEFFRKLQKFVQKNDKKNLNQNVTKTSTQQHKVQSVNLSKNKRPPDFEKRDKRLGKKWCYNVPPCNVIKSLDVQTNCAQPDVLTYSALRCVQAVTLCDVKKRGELFDTQKENKDTGVGVNDTAIQKQELHSQPIRKDDGKNSKDGFNKSDKENKPYSSIDNSHLITDTSNKVDAFNRMEPREIDLDHHLIPTDDDSDTENDTGIEQLVTVTAFDNLVTDNKSDETDCEVLDNNRGHLDIDKPINKLRCPETNGEDKSGQQKKLQILAKGNDEDQDVKTGQNMDNLKLSDSYGIILDPPEPDIIVYPGRRARTSDDGNQDDDISLRGRQTQLPNTVDLHRYRMIEVYVYEFFRRRQHQFGINRAIRVPPRPGPNDGTMINIHMIGAQETSPNLSRLDLPPQSPASFQHLHDAPTQPGCMMRCQNCNVFNRGQPTGSQPGPTNNECFVCGEVPASLCQKCNRRFCDRHARH